MINVNNYLKTSEERIKKLENQQRMKEKREQERKKKKEVRRHFDFGRLVCKYFPDINIITFEDILLMLTDNPELLSKLKEDAHKNTGMYKCAPIYLKGFIGRT